MTGYYLRPGYQSGGSREEAWEQMKLFVTYYRDLPDDIIAEVHRVEKVSFPEELRDCAKAYDAKTGSDLTLRICEAEEHQEAAIVQLASGGGSYREAKEQCRRAFCRLIITECHKRGIEVNLEVA